MKNSEQGLFPLNALRVTKPGSMLLAQGEKQSCSHKQAAIVCKTV